MTAAVERLSTWPVSTVVLKQTFCSSNSSLLSFSVSMLTSLVSVLTLRRHFCFLHVQLNHKDHDFTCFLWPCYPSDPESQLQTYRFRVVLFGSASSPFMHYATLHHHLTQCSSTVSKDLLQNLYVDNILSRCSTEEESVVFYIYQSQNNFRWDQFQLKELGI